MKQEDDKKSVIRILSATYGPSDKRMLINGETVSSDFSRTPYTRDVLPFMKSLLSVKTGIDDDDDDSATNGDCYRRGNNICSSETMAYANNINQSSLIPSSRKTRVSSSKIQGDGFIERNQNSVTLIEGKSMNAIFGDPCPGTTKKLTVTYIFYDQGNSLRKSEICRSTFVEHENIILKRYVKSLEDQQQEQSNLMDHNDEDDDIYANNENEDTDFLPLQGSWKLPHYISEIVIPIFLPFLEIKERVECQLVCKLWRVVIRNLGVAHTVDVEDPSLTNFTRSFLRGLISHSYSSLHSLFLNDFKQLDPNDLHPALPHLRKLKTLDISRCRQLGDPTLVMISEHLSHTLQVLYMKRLPKVTDVGLTQICRACRLLRVLEISNLTNVTDNGGIEIGNLIKLEALYMKDNFCLTNRSIDVITDKCKKLTQLTLWGCNKLSYITKQTTIHTAPGQQISNKHNRCEKIILLNLWGCTGLHDDCAHSIIHLHNLRTLIVSECLRLSDTFVVNICKSMRQLRHLHLRYLKYITDTSVSEIANTMANLYSLDLSFCTKISLNAIVYLIESRMETLAELRLYQCNQIDVTVPLHTNNDQLHDITIGGDGRKLAQAIRSGGRNSVLNTLDVRECKGYHRQYVERKDDERFFHTMSLLNFSQKVPGFFNRPARWNQRVKAHLEQDIRDDSAF